MRTIKTTLLRVKYSKALTIWLCEVIRRRIFTVLGFGRHPLVGGMSYIPRNRVLWPTAKSTATYNARTSTISVDTW